MNDTAKKIGLAVLIVAAGVVAVFGAMRLFVGEQPQVVKTVPGDPSKSMKRQEMEAQKRGTAVGETIANGGPVKGERDLGDLPGGR
jgi:hypothetical protein